LDHRVDEEVSTRRLRIVKYRGSLHGTNEYPFLIEENGLSVLPVTSLNLDYEVSTDRVSTGIPRLDHMFGGKGYYRASTVLVSGAAGTGKSTIAAKFAEARCRGGERCLYFAFEEPIAQIVRNMRSVGIELEDPIRNGCLRFHAARPTLYGLEMHLLTMHKLIQEFRPDAVVVDPVSNLVSVGSEGEVKSVLTRFIDFLKARGITSLFTDLTGDHTAPEHTTIAISSLMDTWILLRNIESNGERNRGLFVLKSRGMAHSNQVREFTISDRGVELTDVYVGPEGMLMGSARAAQASRAEAQKISSAEASEKKLRDYERKKAAVEAQIAALQAELSAEADELRASGTEAAARKQASERVRQEMAGLRGADTLPEGESR
jgi:circadian clock protein KaiC